MTTDLDATAAVGEVEADGDGRSGPQRGPERSWAADSFPVRAVGAIMAIFGAIGLLAAFGLAVEKINLLQNPFYVPKCSLNAVLTCTAVMNSSQAEAFGFPNPLLGLAGFGGVTALGLAAVSGASFARWLWMVIQVGMTFAVLFVHFLFISTVYSIGALCPYCMVVWVATIVTFVYVTLRNIGTGIIPLPRRVAEPLLSYHGLVLLVWFAVLGLQMLVVFWDHWQTLL